LKSTKDPFTEQSDCREKAFRQRRHYTPVNILGNESPAKYLSHNSSRTCITDFVSLSVGVIVDPQQFQGGCFEKYELDDGAMDTTDKCNDNFTGYQ
jgi:hypothetical protein